MTNTNRFDGKGEIYAKARPKYATELFEYLKNVLNIPAGSVFADIGSGTGIFTEQLLGCGYKVYAVEPNDDMLIYYRQGYIDRVLSSSYSLKEGNEGYTEYLKEINHIFDTFSVDNRIEVPMETVAYIGVV